MITLVVAGSRIWLGALLIAAVTAAPATVVAAGFRTAVAVGGTTALSLYAVGGTITVFVTVTALIVLGSVARLTVTLQGRSYALWQLVGIRPGLVRLVVTAQLLLVAVAGAAIGCAATVPVLGVLFRSALDLERPLLGPVAAGSVIVFVAAVVLLGGGRSAGRAAHTPPIQTLREPELPERGMTAGRWVTAAATAAVLAAVLASLPGTADDRLGVPLMLLGPLAAGLLAALGPLVLTRLLRAWTALVPARVSVAWWLARETTAFHAGRSTATISPLMVAIALAGGLWSASGGSVTPATVILLLGGPLLLAVLGAATTIFMASRSRDHEHALLAAAGATPAVILGAAACEAIIYAGTALLLGLACVTVTAVAGALAAGHAPAFGLGAVLSVTGTGLLLTLAATVLPTAAALRQDVPRTLAAE
ncbi:hypothetical protein [Symbioplanes lichenis]|uniref:hypothetical protein n=1 Tax=Symbioplanes lichenis TaxID=1629072 RepID=UPI002739C134|nr:hypothetical protein [Actinoplanes lichenis]